MEQALYNGSISGLSLDGSLFFYENPLESRGAHNRWKWHRCPCCPPNIGRMVASIGSRIYGVADDAIAVHLYGDNTARLGVAGRTVRLTQTSRYPWDGAVAIALEVEAPTASRCICAFPVGAARPRFRSMASPSIWPA